MKPTWAHPLASPFRRWGRKGEIYDFSSEANIADEFGKVAFVFLHRRDRRHMQKYLDSLIDELRQYDQGFFFLIKREPPPPRTVRMGKPVRSFAFIGHQSDLLSLPSRGDACFRVAYAALLETENPVYVRAFQVPLEPSSKQADTANLRNAPDHSVIIPHLGSTHDLARTLNAFRHERIGKLFDIHLGLDQQVSEPVDQVIDDHQNVHWYQAQPFGGGPYVIRDALARQVHTPLLAFQDSDDISTSDRFERERREMFTRDLEMVGSHEIHVDLEKGKIYPRRFPLDARRGLELLRGDSYTLHHPTTLIRREAYLKAGGFSTDMIFGYDTQFLLRAYFLLDRIGNVDDFLYIRTVRPNTLTSRRDTSLKSKTRRRIRDEWTRHFQLVDNGQMRLEDSKLWVFKTRRQTTIAPIGGRAEAKGLSNEYCTASNRKNTA